MKFKAAFLAAASLLVLVHATASLHDSASSAIEGTHGVDVASAFANTIRTEDPVAVFERAADPCKVNCHAPWVKCVRDCGGGEHCEQVCNCVLFSNPKQLCRVRGKIPVPIFFT